MVAGLLRCMAGGERSGGQESPAFVGFVLPQIQLIKPTFADQTMCIGRPRFLRYQFEPNCKAWPQRDVAVSAARTELRGRIADQNSGNGVKKMPLSKEQELKTP